jgi:lipoate-protein ligase A
LIYIEYDNKSPYFYFALEEYLLLEKNLDDDTIFLLWRTDPTVMVGRYQNTIEEINVKYISDHKVNVVRRNSGGGAIYTDKGAWQYTFIVKNYENNLIDFHVFTDPIINVLRTLGVDAYFNNRNDLLIDGRKFCGNAQHNSGNGKIHHGSILFSTDFNAMEECLHVSEEKIISKGIKSIRSRVTNVSEHLKNPMSPEEFRQAVKESLLGSDSTIYHLTEEDLHWIEKRSNEKFSNWEWNYGSSPNYNIEREKRFEGGKVGFQLNVQGGIIENCSIFGDFFEAKDIAVIEKALSGIRYKKDDIQEILVAINAESYFYKITNDNLLECIIL